MADDFDDEPDIEADVVDGNVEDDEDLVDPDVVPEVDADLDALANDPVGTTPASGEATATDGDDEDDENLDLEEELHPDDVEEPLDVLLAERTAAERIDEEEADLEDEDEPDDRSEGTGKIVPRRDDEFLCRSCFLVKPLSQLAKGEKELCRDCE